MRERYVLSPEEMDALLERMPPTPMAGGGQGSPLAPPSGGALLREFVHFLLTGAFHHGSAGLEARGIDVGPLAEVDGERLGSPASWRVVRVTGELSGAMGLRVQGEEIEAEAGGSSTGAVLSSFLLSDLPGRIGRLLGIVLHVEPLEASTFPPSVSDSAQGDQASGSPAESGDDAWIFAPGRLDLGKDGRWSVDVVLSGPLAGGIIRWLAGDNGNGVHGHGASAQGVPGYDVSGPAARPAHPGAPGGHHGIAGVEDMKHPAHGTPTIQPAGFPPLTEAEVQGTETVDLQFIGNLVLWLTVELGRASVPLHQVMNWRPGSIVVLERLAGEMVDVLVNGKPIAKGEVVVVEDAFNVKITDIVSPFERVRGMPWR